MGARHTRHPPHLPTSHRLPRIRSSNLRSAKKHEKRHFQQPRQRGPISRSPADLFSYFTWLDCFVFSYSSHPLRYFRCKYLLALGTLVMRMVELSNSTFLPARNATVPRLTVSVIAAAFWKLPGQGSPPLTASTQEA